MLSRVLGAIGRTCISAGVLILLFVSYQLWGTGILEGRAQEALGDQFEELIEERDEQRQALIDAGLVNPDQLATDIDQPAPTPDTSVVPTSTGDPVGTAPEAPIAAEDDEQVAALVDLIWKPPGDAVAQLLIPKIDVSKTVVAGVGVEELREGPGHYPSTPMPGMPGNAAIAGHRTTYGAPFGDIDQLEPGDEIQVLTIQGIFEYRVIEQENGTGHFIVSPDRVDVLDQDFEEYPNRLTLTACHPKFSARQRIIVVAELVSAPAPAVARPDDLDILRSSVEVAGEELNGEEGAEAGSPEDIDAIGDGILPTPNAVTEILNEVEDLPEFEPNRDEERPTEVPETEPTPEFDPALREDAASDADAGSSDSSDSFDDDDFEAAGVALQGDDDFGEGLNGDSDAIAPAIFWGIAAAAIWLAAWFIGSRWRRWPSYAIGIVPFAIVLFMCFVHIDQALPSY